MLARHKSLKHQAQRGRQASQAQPAGEDQARFQSLHSLARPSCKYSGRLADRDVFVIPGSTMDLPGHFRIWLTAPKEMVERSLPVFAEVAEMMRKERKPAP